MEFIKTLFDEFKKFAFKGNVLELAIAVVLGSAFNALVQSVVGSLLTPVLNLVLSYIQTGFLKDTLGSCGTIISAMISFLVTAIVLFMIVKTIHKLMKNEQSEKPSPTAETEKLLSEIRDLLKEQKKSESYSLER